MDISLDNLIKEVVTTTAKQNGSASKIIQLRPQIMDYLANNSVAIFKQKVAEVYQINSFRQNVVPLERFLESIVYTIDGWNCKIFFDEDLIKWEDEQSEPIYKIHKWPNTIGGIVDNLYDYWQTPIGTRREDEYYIQEAVKSIIKFCKTDFVTFLQQLVRR